MSNLPFSSSQPLPPYRAILVFDAKDFTGRPSVEHASIATEIPRIIGVAFQKAGLGDAYDQCHTLGHTGDGVALGFDPVHLPPLIHPFLPVLQEVLVDRNRQASRDEALLRLRVSVHVGPISDSGTGAVGDGNGKPRNDAHRLLDSAAVKAILASSDERVTLIAGILSQRVFDDVIAAGYCALRPGHLVRTTATVPGKDFREDGYLYVPAVSGGLLVAGLPTSLPAAKAQQRSAEIHPEKPTTATGVDHGVNHGVASGVVHGGVRFTATGTSSTRRPRS